jgi:hypothetical protein
LSLIRRRAVEEQIKKFSLRQRLCNSGECGGFAGAGKGLNLE